MDADFPFIDNTNALVSRHIKSLKIVDNFNGVSFTREEFSIPIDVTEIVKKYNRVPRKITLDSFLKWHILSRLLRLAMDILKDTDDNFVLLKQDVSLMSLASTVFWSDNNAFIWSVEHINRWVFRLGCRVIIGYEWKNGR